MVLKPKEAKEALDYWTNSPRQHPRKCIENSMENMHSDVRVYRVKATLTSLELISSLQFVILSNHQAILNKSREG